jgi:hypothetical protein
MNVLCFSLVFCARRPNSSMCRSIRSFILSPKDCSNHLRPAWRSCASPSSGFNFISLIASQACGKLRIVGPTAMGDLLPVSMLFLGWNGGAPFSCLVPPRDTYFNTSPTGRAGMTRLPVRGSMNHRARPKDPRQRTHRKTVLAAGAPSCQALPPDPCGKKLQGLCRGYLAETYPRIPVC